MILRRPSFAIGVVFALLGASACSKPDATPVPTAPRVVAPPTPPSTAFPASMRGQYYKNYSPPVNPNAQPDPRAHPSSDQRRVEEQRSAKWDELSVAGNSLVTVSHRVRNYEQPPVTVSVTCTGDGMCSFTGACMGSASSSGNGNFIITASGIDEACQYLTGSWKVGNPVSQVQAPSGGFNPQGGGGGGGEGCIMRCAGDQNACVLRCGTSATESATQACVLECAARGQQCVGACG